MNQEDSSRVVYHAFLSHSHADKAKVTWLGELLGTFWIPGAKRRRIFLDNRSLVVGSLDENIRWALKESRYLVVCASVPALKSRWVIKEIRHFLRVHAAPERVLICRTGLATEDDPRVRRWIRSLERVLERSPGDWLVPDLRDGTGLDPQEQALSLLAGILGLPGKDELLDRRARFLSKLKLGAAAAVAVLLIGFAVSVWWLRTPDGAVWNLERRLKGKADDLKYDYPAIVGPAVVALAELGQPDDARQVARIVKGKYFHDAMQLAIAASVPQPDRSEVEKWLVRAGDEHGAGFPVASVMAHRVTGRPPLDDLRARFANPEDWIEALGQATLKDQALAAFADWATSPGTKRAEIFPLRARLHLELRLPVPEDADSLDAWFAAMADEKSVYQAQELLLEAALRRRLDDPAIREVMRRGIHLAKDVLESGYDPGSLAQPLAAVVALSGDHAGANELLERTGPATETIDGNSAAEPLAFRALAAHSLGERAEAERLFARAEIAANAPIEATRTWSEHIRLALALTLAGEWHRATMIPSSVGSELAQRQLEFQLLVWWQQAK